MAIEIGPIAKPFIYLEGQAIWNLEEKNTNLTGQDSFAARVDHAKEAAVTSINTIGGVTLFNQENILTFNDKVRIVITNQAGDSSVVGGGQKFTYQTETVGIDNMESIFEGSANGVSDFADGSGSLIANKYPETWFTINGKDPVRGKAYLWKYADTNDQTDKDDAGLPKPWNGLGFILGSSQTGSDLVTLKAKTYWRGKSSNVAIARFKIARKTQGEGSQHVENGVPIGK